ncbi:MAG: hypothetical protein HYZ40_07190 [Rhodospirillales bacterium]|nr:hypothetical protein [Rhodospirillales bacterium]
MFLRTLTAAMLVLASMPASAQPVPAPDCTVDGTLSDEGGLRLDIVYRCRSAGAITFHADGDRVAGKVTEFRDGDGRALLPSANGWRVESRNGLAEARYRYDLTGYARAVDQASVAVQRGGGVLAILSAWLLEPRGYDRPPTIDIRMTTGPGLVFTSGLPRVGDAWRLTGTTVRFAGYSALGRLHLEEVAVPAPGSLRPGGRAGQEAGQGTLRVVLLDGVSETGRAVLMDWVRRTAEAQTNYWQGFTARQMLLGLVPVGSRRGVGYGRTVPGGGVTVMVEVGTEVDTRRLFDDWVLTHEMIHTGMPFIRGRSTWFMEGAATYVEPIIRARAGWKTEEEVWREWVESMPQGIGAFTIGLANASGRQNYWGGATFMLLADLAIRRATEGAKGLEDCLAGALWSGLDGSRRVDLADYAAACDRATGTTAVAGLIERHVERAEPVDLAALWRELGISMVGGRVMLDDRAAGARWRKMIVMGMRPTPRVRLPWES